MPVAVAVLRRMRNVPVGIVAAEVESYVSGRRHRPRRNACGERP